MWRYLIISINLGFTLTHEIDIKLCMLSNELIKNLCSTFPHLLPTQVLNFHLT